MYRRRVDRSRVSAKHGDREAQLLVEIESTGSSRLTRYRVAVNGGRAMAGPRNEGPTNLSRIARTGRMNCCVTSCRPTSDCRTNSRDSLATSW